MLYPRRPTTAFNPHRDAPAAHCKSPYRQCSAYLHRYCPRPVSGALSIRHYGFIATTIGRPNIQVECHGRREMHRWPTNTIQWGDNKQWRLVKLTIEATKLLRNLVLLSRTEGHPDSPENPLQTRNFRLLELRKRLAQALSK